MTMARPIVTPPLLGEGVHRNLENNDSMADGEDVAPDGEDAASDSDINIIPIAPDPTTPRDSTTLDPDLDSLDSENPSLDPETLNALTFLKDGSHSAPPTNDFNTTNFKPTHFTNLNSRDPKDHLPFFRCVIHYGYFPLAIYVGTFIGAMLFGILMNPFRDLILEGNGEEPEGLPPAGFAICMVWHAFGGIILGGWNLWIFERKESDPGRLQITRVKFWFGPLFVFTRVWTRVPLPGEEEDASKGAERTASASPKPKTEAKAEGKSKGKKKRNPRGSSSESGGEKKGKSKTENEKETAKDTSGKAEGKTKRKKSGKGKLTYLEKAMNNAINNDNAKPKSKIGKDNEESNAKPTSKRKSKAKTKSAIKNKIVAIRDTAKEAVPSLNSLKDKVSASAAIRLPGSTSAEIRKPLSFSRIFATPDSASGVVEGEAAASTKLAKSKDSDSGDSDSEESTSSGSDSDSDFKGGDGSPSVLNPNLWDLDPNADSGNDEPPVNPFDTPATNGTANSNAGNAENPAVTVTTLNVDGTSATGGGADPATATAPAAAPAASPWVDPYQDFKNELTTPKPVKIDRRNIREIMDSERDTDCAATAAGKYTVDPYANDDGGVDKLDKDKNKKNGGAGVKKATVQKSKKSPVTKKTENDENPDSAPSTNPNNSTNLIPSPNTRNISQLQLSRLHKRLPEFQYQVACWSWQKAGSHVKHKRRTLMIDGIEIIEDMCFAQIYGDLRRLDACLGRRAEEVPVVPVGLNRMNGWLCM